MTTLNGTIRSCNAAINRMERERQRQNREATRRFKEQQKLQVLYDARQAVNDYDNYINTIQTLHKDCSDKVNWILLNKRVKPKEPILCDKNAIRAKSILVEYRPSFFDKLFRLTDKRIKRLEELVVQAIENDRKDYEEALGKYKDDLGEWEDMQILSTGIIAREPEFYAKALDYFQPFSDISEIGAKIKFLLEKDYVDVVLHVNGDEVVPNYVLSQTSTGKLSKKNMPKSRMIELYQDHICSAVLRVAREVFAILPVEYVRVNAMSDLLNTQTGLLEEKTILSVIVRPENFSKINLDTIDPSDSMNNFVHTMKFKKSLGFEAVEKVSIEKMY